MIMASCSAFDTAAERYNKIEGFRNQTKTGAGSTCRRSLRIMLIADGDLKLPKLDARRLDGPASGADDGNSEAAPRHV
jgi:hypothetical protein